jgi:hypothetical protein
MNARPVLVPLALGVILIAMMGGCGEDATQPVSDAPVVEAIDDATVDVGSELMGHVVASDEQADALTYTMTVLPVDGADDVVADAGIDPVTGDYWFVPGEQDLPGRTLRFTVTDDGGNVTSTDQQVTVTYDVDQSNYWDTADGYLGNSVSFYAPMGQEFRPASRMLDVVELSLLADLPGTARVRIRDGSISGPVVAESELLELTRRNDSPQVAVFHFTDRVTLTEQHLYVLEIVPVDGMGFLAIRGDDSYQRGRLIWSGAPQEDADLWFREGALPRQPQTPPDQPRPRTDE